MIVLDCYSDSLLGDLEAVGVDIGVMGVSDSGLVFAAADKNRLACYNPVKGKFLDYMTIDTEEIRNILPAFHDWVVVAGVDGIWLSNGTDIEKIENPFKSEIYRVYEIGKGRYSLVSFEGDYTALEINEANETFFKKVLRSLYDGPCYYCTSETGTVVVSTSGEIYIDDGRELLLKLPLSESGSISSCLEGPDGLLWLASFGDGIFRVDLKSGKYYRETAEKGLHDNFILTMYKDAEGAVWAGSWSSGAAYLDIRKKHFNHVEPEDLGYEDADIMAVLETSDKSLWMSVLGSGLAVKKPDGEILKLNSDSGLPSDYFLSLMEDSQGRIWAGTVSSGVAVIDPQSMRVIKRYSNDAAGAEKILSD